MKIRKSKNRAVLVPELGDQFDDFLAAVVDIREHCGDHWLMFVTPQAIVFMAPEASEAWSNLVAVLRAKDW